MTINKIIFTILLLSFGLMAQPEYKQVIETDSRFGGKIPQVTPVVFRIYPVAESRENYKLYFLADVVYDYLQFTLEDVIYHSQIQFEVTLKHSKTEKIYQKAWQSELKISDFKETNSREFFFLSIDSLNVGPGNYDATIVYQDLNGERRQQFKLKLILQNIEKTYFSPPFFCRTEAENTNFPKSFPERPSAFREHLKFSENYALLLRGLVPENSEIQLDLTLKSPRDPKFNFNADTVFTEKSNHFSVLFNLPSVQWREGNYNLSVNYLVNGEKNTVSFPVHVIWFNKPRSLTKYDYAIEPVRLITDEKQYDNLTSGNKEEKREAFYSFWKEKDPTPETALNEVLLEFYNRVDSVDIKWTKKNRNGWRTDPGRIYVLYGMPDEIEDESLNPVNPYMKWTYVFEDRKLIFYFQAVEGRKKYKLIEEKEVANL